MSQNQLLIANTVVTVLAAAVAFGSFIAGIFGMNLDNDKYQAIEGSFVGVTLLTLIAVALISIGTVYYFQVTAMLPSELVLERPQQPMMMSKSASRRYSEMNQFGSFESPPPHGSPTADGRGSKCGEGYYDNAIKTDLMGNRSYQSIPEQTYSS